MFWPWTWSWFGGIFSILITVLIIVVIVRLIVRIATGGWHRHGHWHTYYDDESKNSAIKILQERYAKGEITKEQYESMKKDLEH